MTMECLWWSCICHCTYKGREHHQEHHIYVTMHES